MWLPWSSASNSVVDNHFNCGFGYVITNIARGILEDPERLDT